MMTSKAPAIFPAAGTSHQGDGEKTKIRDKQAHVLLL